MQARLDRMPDAMGVRRQTVEHPFRTRDEMALNVEGVVDRAMHVGEALGRLSPFEGLHFALSSPHRLMRILGAIIRSEILFANAAEAGDAGDRSGGAPRNSLICFTSCSNSLKVRQNNFSEHL